MTDEYSWLVQALSDTGSDTFDVREYSGRFMYGKKCLGIVARQGISFGDIAAVWTDFIRSDLRHSLDLDSQRRAVWRLDTLSNVLADMRQDNMGLDTIYYFPTVSWDESYAEMWDGVSSDDDDDSDDE